MSAPATPGTEAERPDAAPERGGRKRNVFLIGLNEFNRAKLDTLSDAQSCEFHSLLEEPHDYDLPKHLRAAERRLQAFDGPIDAVVGYMDFPVSTMLPLLCEPLGLRSLSLQAMLKCEHKYWSRLEQRAVAPEAVPRFEAVDPFDDEAVGRITLDYPYWIKPVKSAASYLGFRVDGTPSLEHAIREIRRGIGALAEPFQFVLDRTDLPRHVAPIDGRHCIVEEIVSGRQATLEGWVFDGEVGYHGIVDSIRERNGSSFARYEYPSTLPRQTRSRMVDIGRRILEHVGFDNSGFNMEFRWDRRHDKLWLVEINTRVAQHHSDLFEKVDGTTNHEVPVQVALGREPRIAHRQGPFERAAAFFLRRYEDAVVEAVPSPEAIAELERSIPGAIIQLQVRPGMRLSQLFEQDSYSYALAIIYLGARSPRELLERYRAVTAGLRFDLSVLG